MVRFPEVEAQVEQKVLAVSEFVRTLRERHRARLEEARATGETWGSVNSPEVGQAHAPSPEHRIAQAYEQDRAQAAAKFSPSLETARRVAEFAERELARTDEEWDEEVKEQLTVLEQDRDEALRVAEESHTRQRGAIEEFINDQVQAPFNAVKQRFAAVGKGLGHVRSDIWVKSPRYYYLLLVLLALFEFPLNAQGFSAMGVSVIEAYLLAGMLVVAVPIAAHCSGILLKRRHRRGAEVRRVTAAFGVSALFVVVSYLFAGLRVDHVYDTTGLTTDPALFIAVGLLLYGASTLLSYGHHAESPEFASAGSEYTQAEARYQTEKCAAEERRLVLMTNHEANRRDIQESFATAVRSVRDRRAVVVNTYQESYTCYQAMLVALKALESHSHAQCLETIQVFRSANVEARRNQDEPTSFQSGIGKVASYFDDYKELEPPRHIVPA